MWRSRRMRRRAVILEATILLSVLGAGAAGDAGSLVEAVKAGNIPAIQAMLQQRRDPNEREKDGTAALHWAVHNRQPEVVDLLIRAGAGVNVKNRYGMTPLALAVTNGDLAITERLLKAGADLHGEVPETGAVLLTAARV